MTLTSSLLSTIPGLIHGFGTRTSPIPEPLLTHWPNRPQWKQVHRTQLGIVTTPQQICGEVDALAITHKNIPIAVATADCVPILLAKKDGTAALAIHAGWRGTLAEIVGEAWSVFHRHPESPHPQPDHWIAAIGPSIRVCCYPVSEEVFSPFYAKWGSHAGDLKHRHLDLALINSLQISRLGIQTIDTLPQCTSCSLSNTGDPLFFSYRRGDLQQRQWSGVDLIKNPC